jgi:hypothetical protein
MAEYFLGCLLDMLGVERKPPAFDILHDSPSAVGIEQIGPDRVVQTATFAEFQYNGAAIKEQEIGSPDFFQRDTAGQEMPLRPMINGYPERNVQMQRAILIAVLLCASDRAFVPAIHVFLLRSA